MWDFERSKIPTDHHVVEVFETAKSQIADGELELETTSVESLFSPHVYRAFGEIMGYETGAAIPPIARLLIRQSGKKAAQRSAQFLGHVHNGYRRNYSDYQAALEQRLSLREEFDDESQSCDAVLIPVCGVQPFKHRKPESERNGIRDYRASFVIEGAEIDYWDAMTAFTVPVSLMGNPVVTIPLGLDANGLPVGAQLVGKRGQEWSLLDIAHRISAQLRPLRNGYLFGHK